jgi:hypothetical protein
MLYIILHNLQLFFMFVHPIDHYSLLGSQRGIFICYVAPKTINQISMSFILSLEIVTTSLYKTSPSFKVFATHL